MGQRGPKPKPIEALEMTGTFRADRHGSRKRAPTIPRFADPAEGPRLEAARKRIQGKQGRSFFDDVVQAYVGFQAPELELLIRAAQAVDRIEEARALITKHGLLMIGAKGGLVRNPAAIVEKDSLAELRAILKQLDVEV